MQWHVSSKARKRKFQTKQIKKLNQTNKNKNKEKKRERQTIPIWGGWRELHGREYYSKRIFCVISPFLFSYSYQGKCQPIAILRDRKIMGRSTPAPFCFYIAIFLYPHLKTCWNTTTSGAPLGIKLTQVYVVSLRDCIALHCSSCPLKRDAIRDTIHADCAGLDNQLS